MAKYKGYSAAEVLDGNGRRVVKSRSTTAPPSHVVGNVYLIPTGATGDWSTHIGEIAGSDGAAWIYEASPPDGFRAWIEDEHVSIVCTNGNFRDEISSWLCFDADQLLSPNNSDWKVNALAPLSADSNNATLPVRLFDDTTEEGVGWIAHPPRGVTDIRFKIQSRAETAPGAARTVGLKLYTRKMPDNAALGAWSAGVVMTDIDLPANEYWQYDEQVISLTTLGLTANELAQFELCRINPTGGTELTGDWTLLHLWLEMI